MTRKISLYSITFLCLTMTSCIVKQKALELPFTRALRYAKIALPQTGTLTERASFVGFIEPRSLISLHFLIPGRVANCKIKEGEQVHQGKEICRLDMAAIALEVARAENAVKAAKRVMETNLLEKQKTLYDAGVIGQTEFEQVRIQAENAKAQFSDVNSLFEMALKKQKEHILIAPWDGTLTRLQAKPGQPIVPELSAAILSDEKTVQISAELHANYFSKIERGAKGLINTISSKSLEQKLPIVVAEKSITITPETQSFKVVLRPGNEVKISELTPGVLVTGEIVLKEAKSIIKIPQSSLISWGNDGVASVFLVKDKILKIVEIKTGIMDNGWIEVVSGLNNSDKLVAEPAMDFIPGLSVEEVL